MFEQLLSILSNIHNNVIINIFRRFNCIGLNFFVLKFFFTKKQLKLQLPIMSQDDSKSSSNTPSPGHSNPHKEEKGHKSITNEIPKARRRRRFTYSPEMKSFIAEQLKSTNFHIKEVCMLFKEKFKRDLPETIAKRVKKKIMLNMSIMEKRGRPRLKSNSPVKSDTSVSNDITMYVYI